MGLLEIIKDTGARLAAIELDAGAGNANAPGNAELSLRLSQRQPAP
jgi:hypothetical protein